VIEYVLVGGDVLDRVSLVGAELHFETGEAVSFMQGKVKACGTPEKAMEFLQSWSNGYVLTRVQVNS
jgi:hypothetical protein